MAEKKPIGLMLSSFIDIRTDSGVADRASRAWKRSTFTSGHHRRKRLQ